MTLLVFTLTLKMAMMIKRPQVFIVSFLKFSPETTKTYQGIANNYTCDNILNTTSNNTTTCKHNNISKRKQLSLSLSPPQRSLCVLGRLGR